MRAFSPVIIPTLAARLRLLGTWRLRRLLSKRSRAPVASEADAPRPEETKAPPKFNALRSLTILAMDAASWKVNEVCGFRDGWLTLFDRVQAPRASHKERRGGAPALSVFLAGPIHGSCSRSPEEYHSLHRCSGIMAP